MAKVEKVEEVEIRMRKDRSQDLELSMHDRSGAFVEVGGGASRGAGAAGRDAAENNSRTGQGPSAGVKKTSESETMRSSRIPGLVSCHSGHEVLLAGAAEEERWGEGRRGEKVRVRRDLRRVGSEAGNWESGLESKWDIEVM